MTEFTRVFADKFTAGITGIFAAVLADVFSGAFTDKGIFEKVFPVRFPEK